ncbi:MAG: peroxide stress protein YaaA [Blautia sp.]|nr:peroxide stress protein YaaA [Blautia sp.]MDY5032528.1 peroxide stress protein YaaA [Blautia sp.]
MKIILSPAKKMNEELDALAYQGLPVFMEQTEEIMHWMQGLSYAEAKKLWACNDRIAEQNYERFRSMNLTRRLTPAILSYEGIAYQYMAPSVFANGEFDYVQEHLRILSAFYGVVKPLDGVTPYRLEMQAKAKIAGSRDLYDYWGDRLYREVLDDSRIIVSLASKEYAKCIEKYLTPEDLYITCIFGEPAGEKIVQKGVYAKMARGEMVRFMAENSIEDPQEMKKFDRLGYAFREDLSDERTYVFVKA